MIGDNRHSQHLAQNGTAVPAVQAILRPLRGLGLQSVYAYHRLAPWGYRLMPATRARARTKAEIAAS